MLLVETLQGLAAPAYVAGSDRRLPDNRRVVGLENVNNRFQQSVLPTGPIRPIRFSTSFYIMARFYSLESSELAV